MKSKAAQIVIVGILIVVAVGLGVVNKLRTDRRAERVAESLNRTAAPSGTTIHEGPGTVSTSEPVSGEAESAANAGAASSLGGRVQKAAARIDLIELRLAVMRGDEDLVARMTGRLEAEDAGSLFSLISQIPSELRSDLREDIKVSLVKLMQETPGDESARYLLGMLMQDGFLYGNIRGTSIWQLGLRQFGESAPFLEGLAFGGSGVEAEHQRRVDRCNAVGALVNLDPIKYLPLVCREIRSVPENTLWCFVASLQLVAEGGKVDISSTIPDLQWRFQTLPSDDWWSRRDIAKTLASYAINGKSTRTRVWLVAELKKRLATEDLEWDAREGYLQVLKTVEGQSGGSKMD